MATSASLDSAVLDSQKAKNEYEALIAFLAELQEAENREATRAAKKAERKEKVCAVASFPEDYVESNLDRWTDMADEDFAALLSDWERIAAKASDEGADKKKDVVPSSTAMTAAAEQSPDDRALLREVLTMPLRGIDPRRV